MEITIQSKHMILSVLQNWYSLLTPIDRARVDMLMRAAEWEKLISEYESYPGFPNQQLVEGMMKSNG